MSGRPRLAPAACDIHDGGTFTIGMAGGYFYRCGCVFGSKDGQPEQWHRAQCRDERPAAVEAEQRIIAWLRSTGMGWMEDDAYADAIEKGEHYGG